MARLGCSSGTGTSRGSHCASRDSLLVHLRLELRTGEAVLDRVDKLSYAGANVLELTLDKLAAVLHPEPVHLARELVAEFFKELSVQ